MAFKGWPAEAIEFFEGLEADNSKAYWQDHKTVYEQQVRGPMEELLAELAPEFGAGHIFRPYRDVRFSADKSPYKTMMGASLEKGGYVQLSANGLGAGCGMYVMAPDQLDRYRRGVADDRTGTALVALVKTAPRGYPRDHPRVDLLRQKGLITWKAWPVGAWLGTKQAKTRVVEFLRASEPINGWLAERVGPTTMAEAR